MTVGEAAHLAALGGTAVLYDVQTAMAAVAAVLHLIPEFKSGVLTTIGASEGGSNIANLTNRINDSIGHTAAALGTVTAAAQTVAGYGRRSNEWTNQLNFVNAELEQIDKQIAAADF